MPWRCPACQLAILHMELETLPQPNARYRCHICRMELMVNPETGKLAVIPVLVNDQDRRERSVGQHAS